jgi:hypothetical protein
MSTELNHLLEVLVSDSQLHARFINTFSYLEYLGFRKIVKSQRSEEIDTDVLTHALEEARHALKLKRYAIKLGGPNFHRYTEEAMLCRKEAENYFKFLDESVCNSFQTFTQKEISRLTYLYVTLLVEIRALGIYTEYHKLAGSAGSPFGGILLEEENHLSVVETELKSLDRDMPIRLQKFKTIENKLYELFVHALRIEISGYHELSV